MHLLRNMHVYLTPSTYVRTEVNYTEEVEDPVDSDGKNLLSCTSESSSEEEWTYLNVTVVKTVAETPQEFVLNVHLQCWKEVMDAVLSFMWL